MKTKHRSSFFSTADNRSAFFPPLFHDSFQKDKIMKKNGNIEFFVRVLKVDARGDAKLQS